jgi:predicted PolB exonuclease-like 3'-5' exonuclease
MFGKYYTLNELLYQHKPETAIEKDLMETVEGWRSREDSLILEAFESVRLSEVLERSVEEAFNNTDKHYRTQLMEYLYLDTKNQDHDETYGWILHKLVCNERFGDALYAALQDALTGERDE